MIFSDGDMYFAADEAKRNYDRRKTGALGKQWWCIDPPWSRSTVDFGTFIDPNLAKSLDDVRISVDAVLKHAEQSGFVYTEGACHFFSDADEQGTPPPASDELIKLVAQVKSLYPRKALWYDCQWISANEFRSVPERLFNVQDRLMRLPFDGYGIDCHTLGDDYADPSAWNYRCCSSDTLDEKLLEHNLAFIARMKFKPKIFPRMTTCIVGGNPNLGLTPITFYDDAGWRHVLHQVGIYAKVARRVGCFGMVVDAERYGSSYWTYPTENETHTKIEAAQAAWLRGCQLIQAIRGEWPDCFVRSLVTPANGIGAYDAEGVDCLAGPFLVGLLQGLN